MLNVKFIIYSIDSAACQNNSATFEAYSVSDTIYYFFKLLYAFIITVNLSNNTKCVFIKFIKKLYYLLKSLFIFTASVKVL